MPSFTLAMCLEQPSFPLATRRGVAESVQLCIRIHRDLLRVVESFATRGCVLSFENVTAQTVATCHSRPFPLKHVGNKLIGAEEASAFKTFFVWSKRWSRDDTNT